MEESKIKKIYEILNNIPVTEKNKDLIEEIRRELLNEDYVKAFRKIEDMEESKIKKIYEILNNIPVTEKNKDLIEEIRRELLNEDYVKAFRKIEELSNLKEEPEEFEMEKDEELEEDGIYPKQLSDINLERIYIGMLLNDPKQIVKFYFKFEECYFEDADALNAYKSVLFTEGGAYSSEEAKANFNFAKDNEESYIFKSKLKEEINPNDYDMEKIYIMTWKKYILI